MVQDYRPASIEDDRPVSMRPTQWLGVEEYSYGCASPVMTRILHVYLILGSTQPGPDEGVARVWYLAWQDPALVALASQPEKDEDPDTPLATPPQVGVGCFSSQCVCIS